MCNTFSFMASAFYFLGCPYYLPLPYGTWSLKPIFHRKLGLRWLQNAKEINTRNMKCTCPTPAPTPAPTPGTQHHLYSTGNWVCVCYPTRRNLHKKNEMYMADARNWRHLTQKIPTCWYPCVRWRRSAISCVR